MALELAIITDIHYGPDSETVKGSDAPRLLEHNLRFLAEKSPDLLVDMGDRLTDVDVGIDRTRLEQVAGLFQSFDMSRQHLCGNHDTLPRELQETLLGGSLHSRSIDVAGWHLTFLNTFDGTIGGAFSHNDLLWLEEDLASTSLPTVVFSHQPLDGKPLIGNAIFEVDYAADAHPDGHEQARRMMEASEKVKLAVSGHTHWNHRVQVNGIHYLTVQSLVARGHSGEPVGACATLSFTERDLKVAVFGQEPLEVKLKL